MTAHQKKRRAELEAQLRRPDPRRSRRHGCTDCPDGPRTERWRSAPTSTRPIPEPCVASDGHLDHRVTSSKRPRNPQNPLFAVNLLDLLIRHSSANHKRETIAFSKRRQCAAYRLAILLVWRNYLKSVSERRQDPTPAQRLGILPRKLSVDDLLAERLFPTRIRLPDRIAQYYWRRVPTRTLANNPQHQLAYKKK